MFSYVFFLPPAMGIWKHAILPFILNLLLKIFDAFIVNDSLKEYVYFYVYDTVQDRVKFGIHHGQKI